MNKKNEIKTFKLVDIVDHMVKLLSNLKPDEKKTLKRISVDRITSKHLNFLLSKFVDSICYFLPKEGPISIKFRTFLQINKNWMEARENTNPQNPNEKTFSEAQYVVRIRARSNLKTSANSNKADIEKMKKRDKKKLSKK